MLGVRDTICMLKFYFLETVFRYIYRPVCFSLSLLPLYLLFVVDLYSASKMSQHRNKLYKCYLLLLLLLFLFFFCVLNVHPVAV